MEEKEKPKILVVDDEKVVRDFFFRLLNSEDIEVVLADDGVKAVELALKEKFALVFLDIRMPKMNGFKTFANLKKINPALRCVFMTGSLMEEILADRTKQSGVICIRKPFEDISRIKDIVRGYLDNRGNKPDKRAYLRLSVVLYVGYRVTGSDNPFSVSFSKDISPGGIKLITSDSIAYGTELELSMRAKGSEQACNATGKVVWEACSKEEAHCYEIGVEFTEIDYAELTNLLVESGNIIM